MKDKIVLMTTAILFAPILIGFWQALATSFLMVGMTSGISQMLTAMLFLSGSVFGGKMAYQYLE